ncbi:MAG: tetraacyldisaccharide 4'-kinase [Steroidobacteraceae bacterium]
MSLDARLQQLWYGRSGAAWWLLPWSWLFRLIVALRRGLFRAGLLRSVQVSKPVIVIGNLTVGGTGKTPLVIWLANTLTAQGHKVGVITRGYGGKARSWPQAVQADSDPQQVGDEAVLIARQTGALVFAGPDRVVAAEQAIAAGADVVISDDGLQHYRLQRTVELVVIDASRLFGNGRLLPAGPLREPRQRLAEADLVLLNQRISKAAPALPIPHVAYRVGLTQLRSLCTGELRPLAAMRGQQVHVVTGIGNPEAFLKSLRDVGIRLDARVLPDHTQLTVDDIEFGDALPVLMTEKDAVKCQRFAGARHWAVGAEVLFDEADQAQLLQCLQRSLVH